MSDLPLRWRRFQLDSNDLTKARVTTYANDDGFTREQARIDLTEDEARYLIGEIEHAVDIIIRARQAVAEKAQS